MKQGKQFMKAIMLVLALMVASYILYNVVRSASSGVPTAQAVLYAASDGVSVEGFVVRQETVIPAAYDLVLPTKGEGEKVACGEEVAVTLRSAAAQERQEEINQTEKELEQLRLALAYQSQLTDNEDVAQRIASSAASLAGQVAQRRLDAARAAGQELRSLILRQSVGASDTGAMQDQISQLQQQLDSLEASAASDTKSIAAQSAGYYSAVADGYETRLTPQILESMSVSDFQGLWEEAVDAPAQNAGRLIASAQWYYACAVESRYLEDLEVGDSLQVSLGGEVDLELNMTVTRVNQGGGNGPFGAVLSGPSGLGFRLAAAERGRDLPTPTAASGCPGKRCATARKLALPGYMSWRGPRRCGKTFSCCMTTAIPTLLPWIRAARAISGRRI